MSVTSATIAKELGIGHSLSIKKMGKPGKAKAAASTESPSPPSSSSIRVAQGLGGVKRREVTRRPPRGASGRMRSARRSRRVGVEGLEPRASAARSGEEVPLEFPITLYNIDGTLNEAGSITHKVRLTLQVGPSEESHDFLVTSLRPENVILGLPWLRLRNPHIDWQEGTMRLNSTAETAQPELEVEVTRIMANRMERRRLLAEKVLDMVQDEVFCLAGFTYSQQIAEKATAAKPKKPSKKWYLSTIETSPKSSLKKNPRDSLNISHGITP
ncbi:hypothetical protein EDB84DRAFT_1564412 [Lactarius hengduanensis]|nr:hypothetical protein EDB84DRAFT_1564412 [Lactarius hengduanensis]